MQASSPTQDKDKAKEEEDEDQDDELPQEEDIDQGEMKMIMKTRKMNKRFGIKDRHTKEFTRQFKEITPSTPFLVTIIRG
jgi:phosphosulfolactate synthase (CoM biosynthesis protein A)